VDGFFSVILILKKMANGLHLVKYMQRLSEPQYTPDFCWFVEKESTHVQALLRICFENLIVTQHDLNFVEVVSDW